MKQILHNLASGVIEITMRRDPGQVLVGTRMSFLATAPSGCWSISARPGFWSTLASSSRRSASCSKRWPLETGGHAVCLVEKLFEIAKATINMAEIPRTQI